MSVNKRIVGLALVILGTLFLVLTFYIWSSREATPAKVSGEKISLEAEKKKEAVTSDRNDESDGRALLPEEPEPVPVADYDGESAPTPEVEGMEPLPATPVPQIGPPMVAPLPVE